MHHLSRRTLSRAAAAGVVLTMAGISAGLATTADASPSAPRYHARASADLVHVTTLDNKLLGVGNGHSIVDLRVATSRTEVDSHGPLRSSATSASLEAGWLGRRVPSLPGTSTHQSAGLDNLHPLIRSHSPIDLGLARLGTSKTRASAHWTPALASPVSAATVAESAGAVTGLSLVPGSGLPEPVPFVGASAMSLPNSAYSQSRTSVVAVAGQQGLGVMSAGRTSAMQLTVFGGTPQQFTVKVITPPSLTVVAAGTSRSSVQYTSPVVEVVDARGNSHRADAPGRVIEIPLAGTRSMPNLPGMRGIGDRPLRRSAPAGAVGSPPALPVLGPLVAAQKPAPARRLARKLDVSSTSKPVLLRLSLGELDKQVSDTTVSGQATAIRLELLGLARSGTLLDLTIGELRASAAVPSGGLVPNSSRSIAATENDTDTDDPDDTDTADATGGSGTTVAGSGSGAAPSGMPIPKAGPGETDNLGGIAASLPVTGTALTIVIGSGVALVLLGRFAMVMARRRAPGDQLS